MSFGFTATDASAVTFKCTFDGVEQPCKSTKTYAALANGIHRFAVTATDAAGNSASRRSAPVDVNVTDFDTRPG